MKAFKFPDTFLIGSATAAHQVEGNNRNSDWWQWESEGRVEEPSGLACDHWNRFIQDFDLCRQLGHQAHRFSVEWSRVEPEPGVFDDAVLEHYQKVVLALRQRALEPVVTLHHFTNPRWFSEKGGWLQTESPSLFARFVSRVARTLGKHVRIWITVNEPIVYVYHGYITGKWPPGERSYQNAWRALKHLLEAHVQAYRVLHQTLEIIPPMVSFAHHTIAFDACRKWSLADHLSKFLRKRITNEIPVEAVLRGKASCHPFLKLQLSSGNALDFIALNYYSRQFIRNEGWTAPGIFGSSCELTHHKDIVLKNDLGWEIYPRGLYRVLLEFKKYGLPIFITENGICTKNDALRKDFILNHLMATGKAMKQGVDVMGYLYWSLLDNFEWADGFEPRFGLVGVHYETQKRRVRPSAEWFAGVCGSKALSS